MKKDINTLYTNMILNTWRLDNQQSVSIDHQYQVYFDHYGYRSGRRKSLIISKENFLNFNDVILNWKQYGDIGNLPIGSHVWLSRRWMVKRLYHSETRNFFAFSKESWMKYKESIHFLVLHFLRYGCQLQHRKRHANNETTNRNRSRRSAQYLPPIKIPTRPSTNGPNSTEQQTKHSSLSKRYDSTPRCNFKFRRTVNQMRDRGEAASDITSGELANIPELEDIEYCSID